MTKSLKKFHRVENNYMTLSLIIIDKIIDGLSPWKVLKCWKKYYVTLPLKITDGIIDKLSPLEIS